MGLPAGTRLGPYEIVAPLGAGGMGEVYRARDTRLERTVAIKILPPDHYSSPERKQRFEREAKAISSLQHPHICVLHDIGNQGGLDYLVMEYLEGESLADRLHKGPLATDQLLKTGIEIADALDKAHRQGLVHRDLKPGNVMLTKSGAKLLDFGLAKTSNLAAAASPGGVEEIATLTSPSQPVTAQGVVVGTFQYMSPEQVQGKEADARSDIFSLGVLLYEVATGKPAFTGKTQLSLMSAILERQPEPVTALNAASPPALDYVIRACMAKDPADRFQTAHDVSLQLKWIAGHSSAALEYPGAVRRRRRLAPLAGWMVAAAVLVVLGTAMLLRRAPATHVMRFALTIPAGKNLPLDAASLAITADGTKLAYVAAQSGQSRLYIRSLDQFEPAPIPDSEGASFPFFSDDGQWIAFFADGHVRKAAANGNASPVTVTDTTSFYGGAWLPDGTLLMAIPNPPLVTVPAQGGTMKPVRMPPSHSVDPLSPIMLPGGEWILLTDSKLSAFSIVALRVATGESRLLIPNALNATYTPGYLMYYSSGSLWAAPFDAKTAQLTGPAVVIAQDVAGRNFFAHYAVSATGTLVYAPGAGITATRNLVWVDRKGAATKIDAPAEDYIDPSVSPDGKHFVICLRNGTEQALAVYDVGRGVMMRMSGNHLRNAAPIWAPDGKTLYFDAGGRGAKLGIYRMPADGSVAPVLVREMSSNAHITSIVGDKASLMLNDPTTNTDLWMLSLDGRDLKPFRKTSATERQGSFSPDGTYLAYSSDESGRSEVYVEQASASGARWQISTNGGEQPRWSRKGNEIFYRNGTKMMSVTVQSSPFSAAKPVELFDVDYDRGGAVAGYDVTPDGQHFLMTAPEHPNPTEIRVVVGWPEELKQQSSAPARQ
jgi:eukaryotic-like serine/threonine-protein kinase